MSQQQQHATTSAAERYHLLGGFAGDAALLEEIESCRRFYTKHGGCSSVDIRPLVALLDRLHGKARHIVAIDICCPPHEENPVVGPLVRALYEYCFEAYTGPVEDNEDAVIAFDQDFVWLSVAPDGNEATSAPPPRALHPHRTHIFALLPLILRRVLSSATSLLLAATPLVDLCHHYLLRTASTRYRQPMLHVLLYAHPNHVSNATIATLYRTLQEQKHTALCEVILNVCVKLRCKYGRRGVLDALVVVEQSKQQEVPNRCIPWWWWYTSASVVRDMLLLQLQPPPPQPDETTTRWYNWADHQDTVYVPMLEQLLQQQAASGDVLACGKIWQQRVVLDDNNVRPSAALRRLYETYHPCTMGSGIPPNVCTHIEAQAAQGIPVHQRYAASIVKRCEFPVVQSRVDRRPQILAAIAECNVDILKQLASHSDHGVIERKLPYQNMWQTATAEQLWRYLLLPNEDVTSDRFLRYCCHARVAVVEGHSLAESIHVLHHWTEWHLRSTPSAARSVVDGILLRHPQKSQRQLWELWLTSYLSQSYSNHLIETIDCLETAFRQERWDVERSALTAYARYVHKVLDVYYTKGIALAAASGEFTPHELVAHKYRNIGFEALYTSSHLMRAVAGTDRPRIPRTLQSLVDWLHKHVIAFVLPSLSLQFDPTKPTEYISQQHLDVYLRWMQKLVTKDRASKSVHRACAKLLADNFAQAAQDDRQVDLPKGGRHFVTMEVADPVASDKTHATEIVYFDSALHRKTMDVCVSLMQTLMKSCSEVQQDLWPIVKRHCFVDQRDNDYIVAVCDVLSPSLRAEEEGEVISRAKTLIPSMPPATARSLAAAGLLEPALSVADPTIASSLLKAHGGFHQAQVQKLLKEDTTGRDGELRAAGHVTWIRRATATTIPSLMAKALEYTSNRIRNEAGHYRAVVLDALRSDLIREFVRCSLDTPDPEATESLVHSLLTMLRNDLDHRDSVGCRYFKDLPSAIVQQIVQYPNEKPLLEIRSAWISFAVAADLRLTKTQGGNDSVLSYALPIPHRCVISSSAWIEAKSFDHIFPPGLQTNGLSYLRTQFNIQENVKNPDDLSRQVFGPQQFVDMMATALSAAWDPTLPVSAIQLSTTTFPNDDKSTSCLVSRLEALFKVCAANWEESPILTRIFDAIFCSSLLDVKKTQFEYSCRLLETIIRSSSNGLPHQQSFCFGIGRLASACKLVFSYGVKHGLADVVSKWFFLYVRSCSRQDSQLTNLEKDYKRALTLLVYNRKRDSHWCPGKRFGHSIFGSIAAIDVCHALREVETCIPGAALLPPLRDTFVRHRPDVFYSILFDGDLSLKCGFPTRERRSAEEIFFDDTSVALIGQFTSDAAQLYARLASKRCKDTSLGMKIRTNGVDCLMHCPTIGHTDVLGLLRSDVEDPILEALTRKIVVLDSPWHVLASLLSADELASNTNRQRMTGALLAHVAEYVLEDSIVRAVHMLLHPSRRHVLTVSFHKSILRLLFEANSDLAAVVLRQEWENKELHADLRHLLITHALGFATSHLHGAEWAWGMLQDVATDPRLAVSEAALLLSTVVSSAEARAFEHQLVAYQSPIALRRSALHDSDEVSRQLRVLALTIEKNAPSIGVQRLAQYARLDRTELFDCTSGEVLDAEALQEVKEVMLGVIRSNNESHSAIREWILRTGRLYGKKIQRCVHSVVKKQDPTFTTYEKWRASNPRDLHLIVDARQFLHSILDELVEEDGTSNGRRMQLWTALEGVTGSLALMRGLADKDMNTKLKRLKERTFLEKRVISSFQPLA